MHSVRRILSLVALSLLAATPIALQAAEWSSASHKIYSGDYNGDGRTDIFLKGAPKFVPIAGDIMIPLLLPTEHTDYVLQQQSGGDYTVVHAPSRAITDTKSWSASQHKVHVGDFNGDGSRDYFLQGNSNGIASITLLAGASNTVLVGAVNRDNNLVASNATIAVRDMDGDGVDDLFLSAAEGDQVAYGNGIGDFLDAVAYIDNHYPVKPGDTYIGRIKANEFVGKDGSFNYSVPIEVAPGINGMQPNISLNYNSNAKNGIAGWGWSIGGLSVITRCKATLFRDGYTSGINSGDQYKYCMNSQRLVKVGTNVYQTESESYSRIVKTDERWLVYERSGKVLEFGATSNSRREDADGVPYLWSISKVSDLSGNYLTANYEKDSVLGSFRIQKIEYTKNSAGNSNQVVEFKYENRPDTSKKYTAGSKDLSDKRLAKIQIKSNSTLLKSYNLYYQIEGQTYLGERYENPIKTSRLSSLQLCFSDNSACTQPTEFTWSSASGSNYAFETKTIGAADYYYANLGFGGILNGANTGDFDGDGVAENVYLWGFQNNSYSVASYGDPLVNAETWLDGGCPTSLCDYWDGFSRAIMDMDADGKDDVVTNASTETYVSKSTGSSFQGQEAWSSQGLSAAFYNSNSKQSVYFSVYMDFNGDSYPDMLNYNFLFNKINVSLNQQGTGFGPSISWASGGAISELWWAKAPGIVKYPIQLKYGDFNGDGLIDIWGCTQVSDGQLPCRPTVLLNDKGTSFKPPSYWYSGLDVDFYQGMNVRIADVNGDGLSDFAVFTESGVKVSLSTGSGFLPPEIWTDEVRKNADEYLVYKEKLIDQKGVGFTNINEDSCSDLVLAGREAVQEQYRGIELPQVTGIHVALSHCGGESSGSKLSTISTWMAGSVHAGMSLNESLSLLGNEGQAVKSIDVNGDGILDMPSVIIDSSPNNAGDTDPVYAYGVSKLKKNQILSITGGESDLISIDYAPITDELVYSNADSTSAFTAVVGGFEYSAADDSTQGDAHLSSVPNPLYVVAKKELSTGAGGTKAYKFNYEGYKRDRRGYGSLGFAKTTEAVSVNGEKIAKTETEYSQDVNSNYSLVGRVLAKKSFVYDKKRAVFQKVKDTTNQWRARTFDSSIDGSLHYFTYLRGSMSALYDLNGKSKGTHSIQNYSSTTLGCELASTSVSTSVDVEHDAYGNLLHSREVTCDSFGVTAKGVSNSQISNIDQVDKRVLGLVGRKDSYAWNKKNGGTQESSARTTGFEFYSTGQLKSETREPDDSFLMLKTSYSYNDYGSVKSIREEWSPDNSDGLSFSTRTTSIIESFSQGGERRVEVNNWKGQVSTKIYGQAYGNLISETDVNSNTVSYVYDIQGRVAEILDSRGNLTTLDYLVCVSCFNNSSYAEYQIKRSFPTGETQTLFYDRRMREVGAQVTDFLGGASYTYREYDDYGRITSESVPFRIGETSATTDYVYDNLNRITNTVYPDSSIDLVAYDGYSTHYTNRIGQSKTEIVNGAGWLLKAIDNDGTQTEFDYWPFGDLKTSVVAGNVSTKIAIEYDRLGRKVEMNDPNTGVIKSAYNALSLLAATEDANGNVTQYVYDELGRQTSRIDDAGSPGSEARTHYWQYDSAINGVGLLAQLSGYNTDGSSFSERYQYNERGFPVSTTTTIDEVDYITSLSYDTYDRPLSKTYPQGYGINYEYSDFGGVSRIREQGSNALLWQASEVDARGNVTQLTYGNGVTTNKSYEKETGRVRTISAAKGGFTVQNHEYVFDALGNLKSRKDNRAGIQQTFCYDSLNRLVSSSLLQCQNSPVQTAYDAYGNITFKSGLGSYSYDFSERPNAVIGAAGNSYQYDNNGNLISSTKDQTLIREVVYTTFNKPSRIKENGEIIDYVYGPHQQKIKRIENGSKATIYVNSEFEATFNGNALEKVHYLGDFALHIEENVNGVVDEYKVYLHRDHLGSIVAKSGASSDSGNDIEWMAYNAWGERVDQTWGGQVFALSDYIALGSNRGFTDHEHLDSVGLIHMGGRIYDPVLGRFMSPDPFVQAPSNSQSYNRYSYVFNNPLSFVDPTGYVGELSKEMEEVEVLGDISTLGGGEGFSLSLSIGSGGGWVSIGNFSFNTDHFTAIDPGLLMSQTPVVGASNSTVGDSSSSSGGSGLNDLPGPNYGVVLVGRGVAQEGDVPCADCPFTPTPSDTFGENVVDGFAELWRLSQGIPVEGSAVAGVKFGAVILGVGRKVNTPAWKSVAINMDEVISGHMIGGRRLAPGNNKSLFPSNMNSAQVESAIRNAFRYGTSVRHQGERIFMTGPFGKGRIDMWYNKTTKVIETAYPKW